MRYVQKWLVESMPPFRHGNSRENVPHKGHTLIGWYLEGGNGWAEFGSVSIHPDYVRRFFLQLPGSPGVLKFARGVRDPRGG